MSRHSSLVKAVDLMAGRRVRLLPILTLNNTAAMIGDCSWSQELLYSIIYMLYCGVVYCNRSFLWVGVWVGPG